MKKNQFTMLVGLPGSGKSTFCNENPNSTIISLDRLIEQTMTPGETYAQAFVRVQKSGELKKMDREMFDNANVLANTPRMLNRAVLDMDVIWDQTNLTIKSRKRKLDMFTSDWWERTCVVFDISNDEWERRLAKRKEETGKTIPDYVLNEMRKSYQPPIPEEGFDLVVFMGDQFNREA